MRAITASGIPGFPNELRLANDKTLYVVQVDLRSVQQGNSRSPQNTDW